MIIQGNKLKRVALGAFILAALILFYGCAKAPSIVGRWTAPDLVQQLGLEDVGLPVDGVYEFTLDGRLINHFGGKPYEEVLRESLTASGMNEEQIVEMMKKVPVVTYEVKGSVITITSVMDGETTSDSGTFRIQGDKLTLPVGGGQTLVLTRVP